MNAVESSEVPATGNRRLVLALLTLAYTFNFIDRTIIATIGQAIKVDLKISDVQLGLLGGLFFALLYTVLGIPIARLAERASRVNIMSGAIVLWSGFTALGGLAVSFPMLALFRFGVGVGEAGLTPPAHSLISAYFEPRKRASALSIYASGINLGTLFGAIAGGWLAQTLSWRWAFALVGIPGVLVALAMKLLVKEPARPPPEPFSIRGEWTEVRAVAKVLFGSWPVLNLVLGITLASFAGYGGGQFQQPYFIRTFHLGYAQVGLFVGLVGATSAGLGALLGGFIADRLASSGRFGWYALVPALGLLLSYPFTLAVYTAPTWPLAVAWLAFPGILGYLYQGPTYGVIQNLFPPHLRATAVAVMFFFLNLIALGGGPPFVGWAIDRFAAYTYAHPSGADFVGAVQQLALAPKTAYQAICPGGLAPTGSSEAAQAACGTALQTATRFGVLLGYGFVLWAAAHYLMAVLGLKRLLTAARAVTENHAAPTDRSIAPVAESGEGFLGTSGAFHE